MKENRLVKNKIFLSLITASVLLFFCSCGSSDAAEQNNATDSFSSEIQKDISEYLLDGNEEDLKDAKYIAKKAVKSMQERDYDGMAKYIDFEIWYYAAHGKEGTAEEISKGLEDNKDNTEGAAFWFVPRSHYYTFDSAEQIKPEYFLLENAEQSVFFSSEIYEKYKIGKAFRVNVTETYNSNSYKEEIIVAEINGVMKADYAFSMDKKYHDEVLKIALAEQEKEKMNSSGRK